MNYSLARLVLVAACSLGGFIAIGDSARADYYPMMTGYGYTSYYGPSMDSGYWYSGYSPFWTSSFYAPAYASYAPACCVPSCGSCSTCNSCGSCGTCAYGSCGSGACGSCGTSACGSVCGPVCGCDPCNLACATGSCGVRSQAGNSRNAAPTPDNGVPKTYEEKDGKKAPADDSGFRPRKNEPAPGGAPAGKPGDAEEQKTFKPVGPAPTVIEQRKPAPANAPTDTTAPKGSLGPSESKTAAPGDAKKSEGEKKNSAPATDLKKETAPTKDAEPKPNTLQPPKPVSSEIQPPVINLDSKITWRVAPARTRLAVQAAHSEFGTLRIVRQTPRVDLNPAWVPVEKSAKVVQK